MLLNPFFHSHEAAITFNHVCFIFLFFNFIYAVLFFSPDSAPKDGVNLPPYMVKIGGLLLRHILQLVCNAHAITSIQTEPTSETARDAAVETNVSSTEQTRVATAIYPTASLMNHACDPTIVSR